VAELYAPFQAPVFRVSLNTAEFVKYLSNTMLATMISFANEMAMIADQIGGIDIPDAFRILHLDRRWHGAPAKMSSYVYPGCGFGGYCLPKDTLAMVAAGTAKGARPRLLREVLVVNDQVKEYVTQKIMTAAPPESRIGILGLAFKPQSDDVRTTPAKDIIEKLLACGYSQIAAYDPLAMESFRDAYPLPITYAETLAELVDCSDILVLTTAWPEFRQAREMLTKKPLIDGRYFLGESS
jgi:UDPglucose 6-dehydrogenase